MDPVRRHHYQAPTGRGVDACWRPGGPKKSGPPERALLKACSRLALTEALPLVPAEALPLALAREKVPSAMVREPVPVPAERPSAQAPVVELVSVPEQALAPPALRLWSVRPYART